MAVLAVAAGYFYSTGPGKLSVWKELLDQLDLRGGEYVLDIGCGRGAVLVLAGRRLSRGRATGADIWRRRDQTGNGRGAASEGCDRAVTWPGGPGRVINALWCLRCGAVRGDGGRFCADCA
jgi:SAM-dependent methyltransferase